MPRAIGRRRAGGTWRRKRKGKAQSWIEVLVSLLQFDQYLAGDFFQSLKYARSLECHRFEYRLILAPQFLAQDLDRKHVRQVPFVQLQDVRNFLEVVAVFFQVVHQVIERFGIRVHALLLRIRNEDYPVHPAQNQLAAGIVEDLTGDSVKMYTGLESAH